LNNQKNMIKQAKSEIKEEKEVSAKDKALDETIKNIREQFGEGSIMKLGDATRVDVEAIPTGSISLDLATGVGGLPRGRIIEIFGPESSGKTTLALHVVASCQKMGGKAAFIDAEHALDPEYAKRIGVKINDLFISQPDNGEEAMVIMENLVRSGSLDVIVIDSVAALTPKAEIEGEMGASHIGLQARLMSQALRKITAIAAKSKTVIIFINQIRMQIGVMFGNPETTSGGRALRFYASMRLDIRRTAQIKKGEEVIGSRSKVKVVKNKVAAPFKVAEFDIMYNEGISKEGDLISLGVKIGIVNKSGNTYSFGEDKLGVGYDASREFLKQNPKISAAISKEIYKKAGM
jgi:recombination protein RecA